MLDTLLTPLLFLRFGEKPLRRLIETSQQPSSTASAASAEAF